MKKRTEYTQEELRIMGIKQAHDDHLRRLSERKHGGFITRATWEMMKNNDEADGCHCLFCTAHEDLPA